MIYREIVFVGVLSAFFASFLVPELASADITSGLVGYWTFNTADTNWTASTTADLSGNSNTGSLTTFYSATSTVSGKISQALSFDGIDNRVDVGQAASINDLGPLTFSMWMYATGFNQSPRLISKGDRKLIRLNKLTFNHDINFTVEYDTTALSVTTNEDLMQNAWTQLTVTWDGTSSASGVHIYINGVEATYAERVDGSATPNSDSGNGLAIGDGFFGNSLTKWQGLIDDVRIYNRALSPSDVAQLYAYTDVVMPVAVSQNTSSSVSQSGTSVSGRITNLMAIGLYDQAKLLADQYQIVLPQPQVISGQAVTEPTATALPKRDLRMDMQGDDVQALQVFLNANGYRVAFWGNGSPGSETGYFGLLTRDALKKFQKAYNIHPAEGFYGPVTRKMVQALQFTRN